MAVRLYTTPMSKCTCILCQLLHYQKFMGLTPRSGPYVAKDFARKKSFVDDFTKHYEIGENDGPCKIDPYGRECVSSANKYKPTSTKVRNSSKRLRLPPPQIYINVAFVNDCLDLTMAMSSFCIDVLLITLELGQVVTNESHISFAEHFRTHPAKPITSVTQCHITGIRNMPTEHPFRAVVSASAGSKILCCWNIYSCIA